jgi:hypothetical protein
LEAKITLEYADEKTAEAISNSISPDNFKTPIGLNVETILENNKVVSHITCESKLSTFIATIDDLLFSASTAEKTLLTINKMR